tara:strand:- start:6599 stop:8104 length:1506 start_codon:yes stop_codon:yes gene_type:complete
MAEGLEQLKLMNEQLAKMAEGIQKMADNTKELNKETDEAEKKNKSLLKSFSELSNPGTWYGRAWVAVRRISSRVAPEFWAIQNATVGAMDTVKSYYQFMEGRGDKDNDRVKKSLALRIREAAANKEKVDALRDELKINDFQMRNNKMLVSLYKKQKEARDKLEEGSEERRNMDEKMAMTAFRLNKTIKGGTETGDTIGSQFRQGRKNLQNYREQFIKKLKVKEIKETFSALKKMAKGFLKFFVVFILVASAFYLFAKQANLKEVLFAIWDAVVSAFGYLREGFLVVWEGVSNLVGGFMTVVSAVNDILSGDFGAFKEKLLPAIGQMLLGVLQIIAGVIVGLLGAALALVFDFLGSYFERMKETGRGILGSILNLVVIIGTIATAIVFIASGAWLAVAATFLVGAIAAALTSAIPFANGGTVNRRGMQLVGERGPELVSLPVGSRVHNNRESRAMTGGNTINVTVQGRVGASDAELRDIAQKIGHMVNMEVNRTTASRTRGA